MTTFPVRDFRCDDCGEVYPLMDAAFVDHPDLKVLIGGVTTNRFQTHGPGCNGQKFVAHDD